MIIKSLTKAEYELYLQRIKLLNWFDVEYDQGVQKTGNWIQWYLSLN